MKDVDFYDNIRLRIFGFNCPFCGSFPVIDELALVKCSNKDCSIYPIHMPWNEWVSREDS